MDSVAQDLRCEYWSECPPSSIKWKHLNVMLEPEVARLIMEEHCADEGELDDLPDLVSVHSE